MKKLKILTLTSLLIVPLSAYDLQKDYSSEYVTNLASLEAVGDVTIPDLFIGDELAKADAKRAEIEAEYIAQTKAHREEVERQRLEAEQKEQERTQVVTETREYGYDSLNELFIDTGFEGMAKDFIDVANEYNVPVDLLVAISAQETGWGSSYKAVTTNNFGGIKCTDRADYCVDGFSGYNSTYAGLADKAYLLRTYYLDYGLDNVWTMQEKYCPSFDGGCDVWAENIWSIQQKVRQYVR